MESEKLPSLDELTYEILPEEYSHYDLTFKIIVIGDSFVGKSCLTTKGTKNMFDETYSATVGFEFVTSNIKINDKVCKMQIWDTCGQEVYRSLITNFYRNSSLAILVYSIDNYETFENLELWLKELKTFSSPDAKVFLIGNKADLENKRKVDKELGEKYKEEANLDYFMETSAKSGFNAQKVFVEAAKVLYLDYLKYKDKVDKSRSSSLSSSVVKKNSLSTNIKIGQETKQETNKSGCPC
jgi:small GTP-binding protein